LKNGDYLNGVRVDNVEKDENGHVFFAQNYDLPAFNLKDIKSIVTKKQYESMEYKVKDE
jgi:hypothetical protein